MTRLLFLLLAIAPFVSVTARTQTTQPQFLMLHVPSGTTPPVSGPSDFVKISTQTLTGANSYDIAFQPHFTTYKSFYVEIHSISISAGADVNMRTSANGTAFDDAAGAYMFSMAAGAGNQRNGSVTTVNLFQLGSGTGKIASGYLWVVDPANTTTEKAVRFFMGGYDYFNTANHYDGVFYRTSTAILHTIRLYTTNSANFSIHYTLYGVK